MLSAHRVRPSRSRDDVLRVTHCDLQDDIDFTRRSDPYRDEVAYERKVTAPFNISTTTYLSDSNWVVAPVWALIWTLQRLDSNERRPEI